MYKPNPVDTRQGSYTFKNIRYAAPPDGSVGHSCVQAAPNGLNLLGTGSKSPIGGAINQFEDYLFLDIWKLPGTVFAYGGAYVFESKDSLQLELPFYGGTGLVSQSGNNMIFVAMNYRNEGTLSAGLCDQGCISLAGGDPGRVTAKGQSAGGGSITHHVVGKGRKLNPLFSKAIVLSPVFEYMWDRAGTVQNALESFAKLSGCAGQGILCLRRADASTLANANTQLMEQQYLGTFATGVTPDGSTGNSWDIESLILSHTTAEPSVFVNGLVQTESGFTLFLDAIFLNYTQVARITDKINAFYAVSGESKYKSQTDRVQALLRDSSFTCNVRHLTEGFGDSKVWNMQYGVSPGWYGTDLFPILSSKLGGKSWLDDLTALMTPGIGSLVSGFSVALQSYLTSYILTGDPNTNRKIFSIPPAIRWNHPSSQTEQISGVAILGNWGFSTVKDNQNEKAACDFWGYIAAAVTSLGGYSPPGAVVQ
ncbi:Alpha/Beta hydrolase protein [Daldinia sp. FL1419]|nr:Alpha/Beta hydrolase protein [Daldinia sp. FL1419]